MTQETLTRAIPMATWCRMAQEGAAPPVTICLEGDSMRPLIRRGRDPVTIIPLTRQLQRGDVVLFRMGERYIVHRVWKLAEGRVRTFGDNCFAPEPWIPASQVLGLVVKYSREGRVHRLDTPAARAWGRAWLAVHPIRNVFKRLRSFAGRCYRKVFPRRK